MARRRSSRTDSLAVLLGLALIVAAFAWVFTSARSDPGPEFSAPPTSAAPAPASCDDAPSDDTECAAPETEALETLEGAVERFLSGEPRDSDARFLLLSEKDWDSLFGSDLGPAVLSPGGEFEPSGVLADALGERSTRFMFQEEWRVQEGGILVQQLVLLDSPDDATEVLAGFRAAATAAGLSQVDESVLDREFRSRLGEGSFSVAFVDPTAVGFFADRRCAVQTVSTAGPVLLVMTFFEGAGCEAARAYPALVASSAIRSRISEVLENRDF